MTFDVETKALKTIIKTIVRNLNQDMGKVRKATIELAQLVKHPTKDYAWHPDCLTPKNIQLMLNVGQDCLDYWDEYLEEDELIGAIDMLLCASHDRLHHYD